MEPWSEGPGSGGEKLGKGRGRTGVGPGREAWGRGRDGVGRGGAGCLRQAGSAGDLGAGGLGKGRGQAGRGRGVRGPGPVGAGRGGAGVFRWPAPTGRFCNQVSGSAATRAVAASRGSKFGAAPPPGVLEVTRKVLLGCLLCFHLLNIRGVRSPHWRVGRRGDRASLDWNLWTSGASGGGIRFSADRSSVGIPNGLSPPGTAPPAPHLGCLYLVLLCFVRG